MPLYTCTCSACGDTKAEKSTIAERDNIKSTCCNAPVRRLLDAPMTSAAVWTGHKGFLAYNEDGSGRFIESGSDYKKFLKDNRLMPASESYAHADNRKAAMKVERRAKARKAAEDAIIAHST